MGVRGLSTYIHEHLHKVLVRHQLHHRKVIIDGNNLAHVLYFECTGINAAFGGDYDKYASFVEEFFRGLQVCEVYPIVVMDGGQPLDNRKMNTVRERVTNQIRTCLDIVPSNQYRLKVFPCMGRDVFVSTLKKMGIVVLQTDFEADLEIVMLAKELGLTILSNDSDFFMFGVPFILLSSITYNKVSTGKKKKSNEMFSFISCCHFSQEKFCQETGMAATHFPILATLLGNDYLAFDHFNEFYSVLESENRKSRMSPRHNTIKNVLEWLSRHKDKTLEEIITTVANHCSGRNLRNKMRAAMRNYTDGYSSLINMVSENSLKYTLDSTRKANCFSGENSQEEHLIFKNPNLTEMTNVDTLLFCKNGKKLPHWFVSAYRAHRMPHEVADIVTQRYFISPPQVEEKPSPSSYLLVEPIVKTIYTMLWQSFHKRGSNQESHGICDSLMMSKEYCNAVPQPTLPQSHSLQNSWTVNEIYDSDVVVEEDSEGSDKDECEKEKNEYFKVSREADMYGTVRQSANLEVDNCSDSELLDENMEVNYEVEDNVASKNLPFSEEEMYSTVIESKDSETGNFSELELLGEDVEASDKLLEAGTEHSSKECLKWYLRKGGTLWIKKVLHLSLKDAEALPSLSEVESMSLFEKRKVFYSVLNSNLQSSPLDLPNDLELILDFIIYWYQGSSSSLLDIHVISVLMCVFMFYIIDGKVGRIRTRKAFEDEEKWKTQFSILQSDTSYCRPGAGLKDTLAQVSHEECLMAGCKLFKFHHMNQKVNDRYYSRKTVHAFSEYQACIYFVQLLNTLLSSPFPLLSIEHLWGGTFCYNIFFDLKKRPKPLLRVSEILGKGSCLEKLFCMLFRELSEILNFRKYLQIVELVEKIRMPKNENLVRESVRVAANSTTENITRKKKKRSGRKSHKNKSSGDQRRKDSEKGDISQENEESEKCPRNGSGEMEEEVDLLDNRFAGLLLNTTA